MVSQATDLPKPALALSGGGFRAMLFHVGTISRLNAFGLLPKLIRISSVSGGSIASAMLAKAMPRLRYENDVAQNLDAEFVQPLRKFAARTIDITAWTKGTFHPTKSVGDVLTDIYDELLDGMTLNDLPDNPTFVFNTTNLQTGRNCRILREYIADYRIGKLSGLNLKLASAVAASSAFPPVLSPVVISTKGGTWSAWKKPDGQPDEDKANVFLHDPNYTRKLNLTDGGAYDNLGLETVDNAKNYQTLFVSDGGAPFNIEPIANALWASQILRVLDIATDQARGLRKRALFAEANRGTIKVAYAGVKPPNVPYKAKAHLPASEAVGNKLAAIRTRLDPFSDEEQGELMNWGWRQMDLAVRTYVLPGAPAATTWLDANWPLDRRVRRPLKLAERDHSRR